MQTAVHVADCSITRKWWCCGFYLLGVARLLLALRPRLAGAGLLPELLQAGLQIQLLLAGLAELSRLLAVHRFQFAAQLALLGAQLP